MKNTFKLFLALCLLIPSAGLLAEAYNQNSGAALLIPVNTRAGALGHSYTAVGQDASAMTYNAGSLATVDSIGFLFMHQFVGDGLNYEYAALSLPLPFAVLGFNFGYLSIKPFEQFQSGYKTDKLLTYTDMYFSGGIAKEWFNFLSVGAAVKYFRNQFGDKTSADYGVAASAVTMDAGLLFSFQALNFDKDYKKNLRIGLTGRNLFGGMKYVSATHPLGLYAGAGLFYQPFKYVSLVGDAGWTGGRMGYGGGLEILPDWYLTLRGGVRYEDGLTYTGGLGVQYQVGTFKFGFDYALNVSPERGFLHWFGVNLRRFSASLADFTIAGIRIIDIFPGMYKWYTHEPVTTVEIRNNTGLSIEKVKVSFFVKDFMDFPSESEVVANIRPKTSKKIDLSAQFNNKVLEISEDTPAQAQITVDYYADGQARKITQTKNFKMYNRNAMTWDIVDKLASFITPRDQPVRLFARGLVQNYADVDIKGVNEKLAAAVLFFDALGKYGMTYVLDPESPMRKRGNALETVDFIQFPRDCLYAKTGDCDDLTVLFCSLLQNIGWKTALVDTKDHIFMMFDTEVPEEERFVVAADPDLIVIRNGTVWVPVETTMYGHPFKEAWVFAAREYKDAEKAGKLTVIEVGQAQNDFPPVTLSETSWVPTLPSKDAVLPDFNADLDAILAFGLDSRIQELQQMVANNPNDAEALNGLGLAYLNKKNNEAALVFFQKAVQIQPNLAKAWNNMGNVYMLKDDFKSAEEAYLKAIQLNPKNAGYYINLAILYERMGNDKKAAEMSKQAEKLMK
jgi:hypothetical protein